MQPLSSRRHYLQLLASLPLTSGLGGCVSTSRYAGEIATPRPDGVVDATYSGAAGTVLDGSPHFRTLEQALHAAPADARQPWRIALRPGRYREKLEIAKPNIHLFGDNRAECIITYDAYSGQTRPSGAGTWTTYGCATLIVRATGFAAHKLTIENAYNYLDNDAKPASDPTYTSDPQAVALMLARGSDRASFHSVSIAGYQDTLFVDAGRSYFHDCLISGNVDFIFGAGQAVLEGCDIVSRPRSKPNVMPHGYVTAPSTGIHDDYGLVFFRCKLLRENSLVPRNSHALGRPWHPAVTFADGRYADPNAVGSSVFLECFMDDHILQDGWWSMTGLQKTGTTRTLFAPEDARFYEYRSRGPGAAQPGNSKRRQLSGSEAAKYSVARVFGNWQPGPTAR